MISILIKQKLRADNKKISSKITWEELNSELESSGMTGIDAQSFQTRYDEDPNISKLVSSFDNSGILINTNSLQDLPPTEMDGGKVSAMANRALNKRT